MYLLLCYCLEVFRWNLLIFICQLCNVFSFKNVGKNRKSIKNVHVKTWQERDKYFLHLWHPEYHYWVSYMFFVFWSAVFLFYKRRVWTEPNWADGTRVCSTTPWRASRAHLAASAAMTSRRVLTSSWREWYYSAFRYSRWLSASPWESPSSDCARQRQANAHENS